MSDVIILYIVRERHFYRENKYVYVKGKASIFKGNLPFGDNVRDSDSSINQSPL